MEYINERLYGEELRGSMAREDIYKVAHALSRDLEEATQVSPTNIYILK